MGSDYERIYNLVHDLVLAMRSVERTVNSRDGQLAITRMTESEIATLLKAIREADIHAVRTLVSATLANQDLTVLSYSALRARASRLRINRFNKMHKCELIETIIAVEEVLRKQLEKLQRPQTGFIEGDGI